MLKTFRSGIHPEEYKTLTASESIENVPPSEQLVVSLNQHFGKPAIPIVKKGDIIGEGDLIAEADGFLSAPVHAPVSGKIKQITDSLHVNGYYCEAIIIERDIEKEPRIWSRNTLSLTQISREIFIQALKEKGVVGLGGAAFPTFIKFLENTDKPLKTVLINACECEPYINADYRTMLEQTDHFMAGLEIILQATAVPRMIIGIENNKPKAIRILNIKTKNHPAISVCPLKTKYPQGGEKMLISAVLGKAVPRGGLPLDIGVVVVNVNTVCTITDAVFYDKPIMEKTVTVSGHGIEKPKNIRVKIGTTFQEIIDFCGGVKPETERILIGGPMMGWAQSNTEASVLKSTTGLLALTPNELQMKPQFPCVRCGNCVTHCPMGLVPCEIAKFAQHSRLDLAQNWGILDCIECGCCAYSCPAKRQLVQTIRVGKSNIRRISSLRKSS